MRPIPTMADSNSWDGYACDLERWSAEAKAEIADLRAKLERLERVVAAARKVPALGLIVAACNERMFRRDEAIGVVTGVQEALAALDAGKETT